MKKNFIIMALSLLLIPAFLHAFKVTQATNSILAFHTPYQCPLTLQFVAQITADGPGDVKFRWVRSDGVRTPIAILHFARAGVMTVNYDWVLRVYNPVPATQWTRVQILSPNALLSNRAGASVTCRPR
jgi:hypothetical protein